MILLVNVKLFLLIILNIDQSEQNDSSDTEMRFEKALESFSRSPFHIRHVEKNFKHGFIWLDFHRGTKKFPVMCRGKGSLSVSMHG